MSDSESFDIPALESKISAARTRLILDKPFLGALVLRLPLQAANPSWCVTTGTDARKFYYSPAYIQELRPEELQFVLAHEALHCALGHFARRGHRIKHRWDLACDYAINPLLVDEDLKPPPDVRILNEYRNMSAEVIYPCIDDNDQSETMDHHLYDKPDDPKEGGQEQQDNPLDQPSKPPSAKPQAQQEQDDSQGSKEQDYNPEQQGQLAAPPPELTEQEKQELSEQWQKRLAGAMQQAKQAGKLSGGLARLVETEGKAKLSWRALLGRHMLNTARDDYSFARPSSRRGEPAIFPTLKSAQIHLAVAMDISGSITDQELASCLSEINVIQSQIRASVTLIPCDHQIAPNFPQVFHAWETLSLPASLKGGGGTDFYPVFDWLKQQDQAPDLLVYFTDAQGSFPDFPPHFPVLWLVKGNSNVPWGERIQLNE